MCRRLLEIHIVIAYTYYEDDWPIFMISGLNEQLQ